MISALAAGAPAESTPLNIQSPAALSSASAPGAPRAVADRAQQLAAELMQARQELSQRQVELRRVGAERNALKTRLAREIARVRELESALKGETELRQQAADRHNTANTALRGRVAELEARLAELEAQLAERPARVAGPASSKPKGDLRDIRGIGPAYQRSLREHGVSTIEQIAAWSAADVESIAAEIKVRAERIRREDWVGQAQALLAAKS